MNLIRRDGKWDWIRFVRLTLVLGSFTIFGIAGCGNRMGCRGGGDGGVGAGDRDTDGVRNDQDNCPDAANPLVAYQAGDSLDECAVDEGLVDNDGMWQPDFDCDLVGDACDNAPLVFNPRVPYQPGDSIDDCAEDDGLVVDGMWQPDTDCDGVGDAAENCPEDFNPLVPYEDGASIDDCAVDEGLVNADNLWQPDTDCDGVGDVCDNCPFEPNPDQSDRDGDGIGDVCDNAPDTPNPDQGDEDGDGVGDVVDNCPEVFNPLVPYSQGDSDGDCALDEGLVNDDGLWQPDTDCDGVGDACPPDDPNGPPPPPDGDPVVVMIADRFRIAFPCEVVEFTATTNPAGGTISWNQIGGPAVQLTANDGTVQVDLPPKLTAGQAILLRATATFPGRPNGTTTAEITVLAYDSFQQVETKSGGAVQPGEQIEIRLADNEDDDWRVHWTQNPNDPPDAKEGIPNPITTTGNNQTARFNAPNVVRTRKLRFNATGCMAKNIGVGLMGDIVVPVQRAQIDEFNLPDPINVGQQISVPELLMVSLIRTQQGVDEPHMFEPEVDGGDPNDPDAGGFQILIFVLDQNGEALPDNVDVDIDPDNATFTVTAAPNNTTIRIRVLVLNIAGGPANPLAEITKTTTVVGG
jgi:hypothetical protein